MYRGKYDCSSERKTELNINLCFIELMAFLTFSGRHLQHFLLRSTRSPMSRANGINTTAIKKVLSKKLSLEKFNLSSIWSLIWASTTSDDCSPKM